MRLSEAQRDALMALPADGSEAVGLGWRHASRLQHLARKGLCAYEVRPVPTSVDTNGKAAFWRLTPAGAALLAEILPAVED